MRISSYKCGEYSDFKLTVKSEGYLSREEIETYISKTTFDKLAKMIDKPLVTKQYRKYELGNGLVLECSLVDEHLPSAFMYAEIEFKNEQEADMFIPISCLGKEVTYDSEYKMKNYWSQTRL